MMRKRCLFVCISLSVYVCVCDVVKRVLLYSDEKMADKEQQQQQQNQMCYRYITHSHTIVTSEINFKCM